MRELTAWSYSRLSTYRKCPRQFKYRFVERRPVDEKKSSAMVRGNQIDEALQHYVEKKRVNLPSDLKKSLGPLLPEVVALRKDKTTSCQLELAVTKDWTPTGWFDNDVWLRAKLDVKSIRDNTTARVIDYKSGKMYPAQHAEQLEIYAAVTWAFEPTVEEILAEIFYVDLGVSTPALFQDLKKTITKLRKKWEKIAAPMFKEKRWEARPGNECRWCPFSQRKGGPCDKG